MHKVKQIVLSFLSRDTWVLKLSMLSAAAGMQFVGTRSATKENTWCDVSSGHGKEAQRMLMMSTSER